MGVHYHLQFHTEKSFFPLKQITLLTLCLSWYGSIIALDCSPKTWSKIPCPCVMTSYWCWHNLIGLMLSALHLQEHAATDSNPEIRALVQYWCGGHEKTEPFFSFHIVIYVTIPSKPTYQIQWDSDAICPEIKVWSHSDNSTNPTHLFKGQYTDSTASL